MRKYLLHKTSLVVLHVLLNLLFDCQHRTCAALSRHEQSAPANSLVQAYTSLISKKNSSIPLSVKNSNYKVTALVDKSVTLTCAINLDDKTFPKSENYKIIWSREIDSGKDYEPMALDDARLIQNQRVIPSRIVVNKQTHDQIQWTLVINNLKLSDTSNYICQLNQNPYDIYWLKRFMLTVYEPASFVDNINEHQDANTSLHNDDSVFIKTIDEYDDFKLKCLAKGKPKPTISWFLKYVNGSTFQLDVDNSEIVIKNVKRNSKIDKVECQIFNGYGAIASRTFKINIRHAAHFISKSKTYRVPTRTNEVNLNCSIVSNPPSSVNWMFASSNRQLHHLLPNQNENAIAHADVVTTAAAAAAEKQTMHESHLWKSINSIASLSQSSSSSTSAQVHSDLMTTKSDAKVAAFVKLPLSKYQIYEKYADAHHMHSILTIRMLNEKDYGIYKCVAVNQLGNRSIDFKLEELNNHARNKTDHFLKHEKNVYAVNKKTTKPLALHVNSEDKKEVEIDYNDDSESNGSNQNSAISLKKNVHCIFLFVLCCVSIRINCLQCFSTFYFN